METADKKCSLCGKLIVIAEKRSLFAHAGEWLAEDVWKDSGEMCDLCLENRGRLALMYMRDKN